MALGGLDVGYSFGRTAELRLGYEGGKKLPPLFGSTIDALGMFEIGKTYQPPFALPGCGRRDNREHIIRTGRSWWRGRGLWARQILLPGR